MSNWKSIGYAAGLSVMAMGKAPSSYPTRDKHSADDEKEYLEGYGTAQRDFISNANQHEQKIISRLPCI